MRSGVLTLTNEWKSCFLYRADAPARTRRCPKNWLEMSGYARHAMQPERGTKYEY